MRIFTIGGLLAVSALLPAARQGAGPETLLRDRFHLSEAEVAQARGGQPVAKMLASTSRGEYAIVGAIRLPGDKTRLAEWIKNVPHFRASAEMGAARVIPAPPTQAGFAELSLAPKDLSDLEKCTATNCAMRIPRDTLTTLKRDVRWGTPDAKRQAETVLRDMLAGYAAAYLTSGNAGVAAYEGGSGFANDINTLLAQATTLPAVAPELASYIGSYPSASLPNADQLLYWSVADGESFQVITLHQLVVFRRGPGETYIADKTIYASRFFDAGVLVVSLADAEGGGFYAIAASRIKSA
ncbi:MAG TPA: hypothetical protein VF147_03315, partial [Vicinamibacterales bacterium]